MRVGTEKALYFKDLRDFKQYDNMFNMRICYSNNVCDNPNYEYYYNEIAQSGGGNRTKLFN